MTRISFLYPNVEDSRFDFEYYLNSHMPWSIPMLSLHPGFKGVSVERGLSNGAGAAPTYVAVCHFLFETLDDFMAAVTPSLDALRADMKNYTDVEPTIQIGDVLISATKSSDST